MRIEALQKYHSIKHIPNILNLKALFSIKDIYKLFSPQIFSREHLENQSQWIIITWLFILSNE